MTDAVATTAEHQKATWFMSRSIVVTPYEDLSMLPLSLPRTDSVRGASAAS
jgi:hypothetical protein